MSIISGKQFRATCEKYGFLFSVPKTTESKHTYYKYLEIMKVSPEVFEKLLFKHGAQSKFFPTPSEIRDYLKPKIQRMTLDDVRNPTTEYHQKVRQVLLNDFDFYYPNDQSYEFRTRTIEDEKNWRKDSQIKINRFFKEIELDNYDINNLMSIREMNTKNDLKLMEGKEDA